MDKRGRPGYVNFTIEIPIETVEYPLGHGNNFINKLKRAVSQYHSDPCPDPAKAQKTRE